MSTHVAVDASVWVARLVQGDHYHAISRQWLEEQRLKGVFLVSPGLLLVEVAGAIARRTGDAQLARRAVSALKDIGALTLVSMEADLVELAAEVAADLGLRGADALYLALAARLGIPLATLDQYQRERASGVVKVMAIDPQIDAG
jgi:predicted nucleic acid-binding protein